MRFVVLNFMTAPPNYRWQMLLERTFPAYPGPAPSPIDLESKGRVRKSDEGYVYNPQEMAKPKLSWRNTLSKWFIDCITIGTTLNTVGFLLIMGVLKGQTIEQLRTSIWTVKLPALRPREKM